MAGKTNLNNLALSVFVLGVLGIVTFWFPYVGLPVQVIGLAVGLMNKKSSKNWMIHAGIILCIIGLVLTVANLASGIYTSITTGNVLF